ncbi:MAG: hypothetical protein ABSH51_06005 [Solirubrobacteraceae bacterium]|jgi:hypothetical protein
MSVTAAREAKRLAAELARSLGEEPITPQELASRLVVLNAPVALISALDDALSCAAAAGEPPEFDDALWGPEPTGGQLLAANQTAHAALMEALALALDGALTREQVAQRLGVSPQAVSKRLAAGGLVALSRGRQRRFPAWQFSDDGPLPGLAKVIAAWPGTMLALTTWANSPSADLGDATPARVLAQRDGLGRVLAAEAALSSAAW